MLYVNDIIVSTGAVFKKPVVHSVEFQRMNKVKIYRAAHQQVCTYLSYLAMHYSEIEKEHIDRTILSMFSSSICLHICSAI